MVVDMRFYLDGWLTLGALISLVLCGVAIGNLTTRSHAEQNLINTLCSKNAYDFCEVKEIKVLEYRVKPEFLGETKNK